MNFKQRLTIVMFVFLLIAVFLFFNKDSYTGYVAGLACSDYPEQSLCSEDPVCDWDSDLGVCMDISASQGEIQGYIAALQSLQNDTLEIISALKIDIPVLITSLNDLDLQVQAVQEDILLNDTEKQEMIANIETQAGDLLADVPQVLTVTKTVSGLTSTPVENITPSMLDQQLDEVAMQQLYELQNKAESKADIQVISMLTFSGGELIKTYIKKTVEAPVQDGYVVEIIPGSVLASVDELSSIGDYEVVDQDPFLIKIPFSNDLALYSYILSNDVSALVDEIQFAVIPSEIEPAESVVKAECGDGKCTEFLEDEIICPKDCARKIPWLFITVILVILILGIILIGLYKHKLTKMEIKLDIKKMFKPFRKKQLFETDIDRQNLKNYIRLSLKEHIEEPVIKSTLLSKGWTEQQVNFVLNEVKQESSKSL